MMMNQTPAAATGLSRQELAELRHSLRTPLNQVLGYADMLLEDAQERSLGDAVEPLRRIQSAARQVLGLVQTRLAPENETAPEAQVEALREAVTGPVHEIVQQVGALAQSGHEPLLADVLRISTAAVDLVAFAQGDPLSRRLTSAAPLPAPDAPHAPGQGRLLVVDDNEANRDMLCRQLERFGYAVHTAEDGEEALARLRQGGFDLLLLDVMMPGMNGIQVLEALQSDPSLRGIPVVMVSALDELGGVAHCLENGAEDYLFKPFDPILLRARASATLERKRLRDSELRRTRELEGIRRELERSNQDLQRFASLVSHDLQTPLRNIVTHLQLVERRLGASLAEEDRILLTYPLDAARRMSELVASLLDYSSASTAERAPEPVALDAVLDTLLTDFAAEIAQTGASITHDPLPTIVADRVEISRVFQNLIGNALKYRGAEPPRIHVSSRLEPGAWHFVVRDNGIGIPAEHLASIFQMYRRGAAGDVAPGSGLGLAICQRIVERLRGRIWAESRAGEGSEFHILLPATGRDVEAKANA